MSTDATTPSNKTLDDIINNAQTGGEMVEALRAYNIGVASKELVPPPPTPVAAPQHARMNAFRVIYPHDQARFELVGVDEADLDRQEKQIRALYAGK